MIKQSPSALDLLVRNFERFGSLEANDHTQLAKLPLQMQRVPRGHDLVREGDPITQCCLLVDGFTSRYKEAVTGARQIVSFHLRGDMLDIEHLLLDVADHSLQAITDATLAWIPKAELVRLAWDRPAIGKALWRMCLIDASIFREWVLNVGRRTAKARIAHMLCEFLARCEAAGLGNAQGFELPMTQAQIADATGLTVVHVSRTLRLLNQEGAVGRDGGRLRVLDWDRLCRIADFDSAYLHEAA